MTCPTEGKYTFLFDPNCKIIFSRLCYYLNEASVGMRRGTIYLANRKVSVTRSATRFGFDVVSYSNYDDRS